MAARRTRRRLARWPRVATRRTPLCRRWHVTGDALRPIHADMTQGLEFLISVAEMMILLLVEHGFDRSFPFIIHQVPEEELNPYAPVT